jgi:hypothetical protein
MTERKRRIAENEAIFRSVNEEVNRLNDGFSAAKTTMRIVCECGVQSCTVQITIEPSAYHQVRQDSMLFVTRPGHDFPETETVVEKSDGYWVVRKHSGVPAEIAVATDPRTS